MATFTQYFPGPTINEQYGTLSELFFQFYGFFEIEKSAVIGGSPARTWYPVALTAVAGATPYLQVQYNETTGTDSAFTRHRYDPALFGMLDPAYLWTTISPIAAIWNRYNRSQISTWEARAGVSAATIRTNLWTQIVTSSLTGGGTSTASIAEKNFTDGPNAGQGYGVEYILSYDPTIAEFTGGTRQLYVATVCVYSDADDGSLNLVLMPGTLGQALETVPEPLVTTPEAEASWMGLATSQPTDKRNVSHADDLGEAGGLSDEPVPTDPDLRPIYIQEGAIQVLVDTPAAWLALTTLPSVLFGALATVGHLISTLASLGTAAAVTSAATALASIGSYLGSIATAISAHASSLQGWADPRWSTTNAELDRIADAGEALPGQLTAISSGIGSVSTAIGSHSTAMQGLVQAGPTNDLVAALGSTAVAESLQVTALQGVEGQLSPTVGGSLADQVIAQLKRIGDELVTLNTGQQALRDRLADISEASTDLRVKLHGIEVHAQSGAILDPEP